MRQPLQTSIRPIARLACAAALASAFAAAPAAAQTDLISTVAGNGTNGYSGDGGPATAAELGVPVQVVPLPDGGYLIFSQGGAVVRRVAPDGTITTIAGTGTAGFGAGGKPATSSELDAPSGGAMTADGGYLIADANNNRVQRVAPDGTVTTAAGTGAPGSAGDGGPATAAQLAFPYDIAVQPDGGYLIADADTHRIRRVSPNGIITTVAGNGSASTGGDGGAATSAAVNGPSGVALTGDGGFLIAEADGNRVRRVTADGTISTVAGTGAAGFGGDGGPATSAQLNQPTRVEVTADGGFVISDRFNHRIRRVAPDGTISTVAGTGTAGYDGDGVPATQAQLNNPIGVGVTADGDLLIADTTNSRVRFVDAASPPPVLTGTAPVSPANDNVPRILGTASAGSIVNLFTNPGCTGAPAGTGGGADFPTLGIGVTVPDNSTTTFFGTATDIAGNVSACSTSSATYVENSALPGLPAPVQGSTVNAIPVKGTVLVKLPRSAAGKAHAAATGFVPLETIGRQIPVGSRLDTTQGTVLLTSAAGSTGGTQDGRFRDGQFKVSQTRKNPLTTLTMEGGRIGSCPRKASRKRRGSRKVTAAARRRRTLFSNVKGRFRTRGRHSAATVRGTSWRMTDTCRGTLTSVKTGSVKVRDFRLRKTRTVRAGQSYLARAKLRKKRRR